MTNWILLAFKIRQKMNNKAKLVLVDDDQDFLLSLKQLLEYSDYQVTPFSKPEAAYGECS